MSQQPSFAERMAEEYYCALATRAEWRVRVVIVHADNATFSFVDRWVDPALVRHAPAFHEVLAGVMGGAQIIGQVVAVLQPHEWWEVADGIVVAVHPHGRHDYESDANDGLCRICGDGWTGALHNLTPETASDRGA